MDKRGARRDAPRASGGGTRARGQGIRDGERHVGCERVLEPAKGHVRVSEEKSVDEVTCLFTTNLWRPRSFEKKPLKGVLQRA